MSGAAGLSAARRRRAGGASMSQNQVVQQKTPPVTVERGRISVQSILENHEIRLRKIEPTITALVDAQELTSDVEKDSIAGNIVDNNKAISGLVEQVAKLSSSLQDIQATVLRLTNKVAAVENSLAKSVKSNVVNSVSVAVDDVVAVEETSVVEATADDVIVSQNVVDDVSKKVSGTEEVSAE